MGKPTIIANCNKLAIAPLGAVRTLDETLQKFRGISVCSIPRGDDQFSPMARGHVEAVKTAEVMTICQAK